MGRGDRAHGNRVPGVTPLSSAALRAFVPPGKRLITPSCDILLRVARRVGGVLLGQLDQDVSRGAGGRVYRSIAGCWNEMVLCPASASPHDSSECPVWENEVALLVVSSG